MNGDIIYEMKSLFREIHREFALKNKNIPAKPTPTQMEIMEYIDKHQNEKIYQKDLEKILNVRRATVSEVLSTMEKNGLIDRKISDNDLRSKEIIISDKAKAIFKDKDQKIKEMKLIITKNISDEELNIFMNIVNKMKNNLKEGK